MQKNWELTKYVTRFGSSRIEEESMEEKILVVDDAMFMRRIIKSALAEGGYHNIIEAKEGEEALRLYKTEKPQVVLLDITMPGMSGIEVLEKILEYRPGAKVIMCSAIGQEATIEKAIRMGAYDFIVKPFQKDELLKMVRQSL